MDPEKPNTDCRNTSYCSHEKVCHNDTKNDIIDGENLRKHGKEGIERIENVWMTQNIATGRSTNRIGCLVNPIQLVDEYI